jgi:hypothetical protein
MKSGNELRITPAFGDKGAHAVRKDLEPNPVTERLTQKTKVGIQLMQLTRDLTAFKFFL